MYAVIRTGGKQYRVEQGQQLDVERLGAGAGGDVDLTPVLVVDGDRVLATPEQLGGATVRARIVDSVRAPKIIGFTYKSKSNQRKRWGHRQHQSRIEITAISAGGAPRKAPAAESRPADRAPAEKAPAEKAPAKKAKASKTTTKKAPAKKPAKKSPAKKGTG
jgi:large subunit ribosomal protein L21